MALNDEDVRVRGLAIDLAGRLGGANPAVVLPALRRHLMQLLADLEHSPDSRQREGASGSHAPRDCRSALGFRHHSCVVCRWITWALA